MCIDHESADALRPWPARPREHRQLVRDGPARDVDLVAVQDVVVAIARRPRLQVRRVRAVVRLGQAERRFAVAVREGWQPLLLLLRGPAEHDRPRRQPAQDEHQTRTALVLRHLFDRQAERQDPVPRPAHRFGDSHPQQARLLERFKVVVRVLACLVQLLRPRGDNLSRDPARRILDQPVFFGKFEIQCGPPAGGEPLLNHEGASGYRLAGRLRQRRSLRESHPAAARSLLPCPQMPPPRHPARPSA